MISNISFKVCLSFVVLLTALLIARSFGVLQVLWQCITPIGIIAAASLVISIIATIWEK